MTLSRRDLLKASAAIVSAIGLGASGAYQARKAFALDAAQGGLPVVWLQGQSCTGCSVSLLNSIKYGTIDGLLVSLLDVQYHPNVMAAAGEPASGAAENALARGGYVLVVEGAIPIGENGDYCMVWPGMTALAAVEEFAAKAVFILAVGTCASFGGLSGGKPNPTGATGVMDLGLGTEIDSRIVNLPGCPAHPDWVVGTVAYLLKNGRMPALDSNKRPIDVAIPFYRTSVHDNSCPNRNWYNTKYNTSKVLERGEHNRTMPPNCLSCHRNSDSDVPNPRKLAQTGCLYPLGCRGRTTYADCGTRKWNAGSAAAAGVNWCIGAGAPCHGCTEPTFPDGMSPFFYLSGNRA
jgi:hydrogenase small subunit